MLDKILHVAQRGAAKILGENVKIYRKRQGWTQEQLAEKTGLSREYIGSIEIGASWVGQASLCSIATALGVPDIELFQSRDVIVKPTIKEALETIGDALGVDLKIKKRPRPR